MGKLLKCHDCGHQVSQKAKTCPNCGRPDPSAHPVEKLLRGQKNIKSAAEHILELK